MKTEFSDFGILLSTNNCQFRFLSFFACRVVALCDAWFPFVLIQVRKLLPIPRFLNPSIRSVQEFCHGRAVDIAATEDHADPPTGLNRTAQNRGQAEHPGGFDYYFLSVEAMPHCLDNRLFAYRDHIVDIFQNQREGDSAQ